jgi:hypothetical protein
MIYLWWKSDDISYDQEKIEEINLLNKDNIEDIIDNGDDIEQVTRTLKIKHGDKQRRWEKILEDLIMIVIIIIIQM